MTKTLKQIFFSLHQNQDIFLIQLYKGPSRQRSRSMQCAQMWYW
jgi:hypothetical protein